MSVTQLAEGGSVHCVSGQVELQWTAEPVTGATLDVARVDGAIPHTVERRRGVVGSRDAGVTTIIPRVDVPVRVGVRSVNTPTFPDGTRIRFRLVAGRGESSDLVEFSDKDVSGLGQADLLQIEPASTGLLVRYPRTEPRPPTQPHGGQPAGDEAASPQARAALYAARRCLGAEGVPDTARVRIGVAVDRSASMIPHLRSGLVSAVLDALIGINAAVGVAGPVPVWDATRPDEDAEALTPSNAAAHGADWIAANPPVSAAGYLAPLLAARTRLLRPPAVLFVLTDDIPTDLEDVTIALSGPGGRVTCHLIVLAVSALDFRRPERPGSADLELDPLAALVSLPRHGIPVTVVSPDASPPLSEAIATSEPISERLAESLLRPHVHLDQ